MEAVEGLSPAVGVRVACRALGVARATLYRHRRRHDRRDRSRPHRPTPARALSGKERDAVLEVLHTPRFVDRSPAQAYATLLDEETYLCSVRTMYRLLDAAGESRERRRQLTHPRYVKPQLLATHPNEVWSWDIERHEALWNRAVMKGHRHRLVAASRLKLRAA